MQTKQEKVNALREQRRQLNLQINSIDKQITELNRKETLQQLQKNIGKYFRHEDTEQIDYVFGVDKKYLRNWCLSVTKYGKGKDAWFSFEKQSSIYCMQKLQPCSKRKFDSIMKEIKQCIKTLR